MIVRRLLTACAALWLAPAAAAAQWTVEAAAGRAVHDPVSARVPTTSASLGAAYAGGSLWTYLSAGVPLEGAGPGWGAAGAGAWVGLGRGPVRPGIEAGVHGFGYGPSGPNPAGAGGAVEALAGLVLERGPFAAALLSGVAAAGEAAGDSGEVRRFHDSALRLSLALPSGLSAGADARLLRGEGADQPYVGAGVEMSRRWGGVWAQAGRWLGARHPAPANAYGAGVRLRAAPGTELRAALRQEPFHPLYRSTPRRSWSVSLARTLGASAGAAAPAAPRLEEGAAHFRLPREDARPPVLIGDFSGWEPVPMRPEGAWWVARVRLAPGAYHYAFRAADGTVLVPAGVPTVDDGFGGRSAVLVVP